MIHKYHHQLDQQTILSLHYSMLSSTSYQRVLMSVSRYYRLMLMCICLLSLHLIEQPPDTDQCCLMLSMTSQQRGLMLASRHYLLMMMCICPHSFERLPDTDKYYLMLSSTSNQMALMSVSRYYLLTMMCICFLG
jgi:hypothetical protein